jgi:hypothetical protein
MELKLVYRGDATRRFHNVLAALGRADATLAMARALNRQGDKARTEVRRALAAQLGVGVRIVRRAMRTKRAFAKTGRLEYEIESTGKPLSLTYFKARQTLKGVSAAPLNQRQLFAKSFNTGGSFKKGRKPVMGGHVFIRTTSKRWPVEKLYGPSVPEQMVRGASLAAFESAAAGLEARLDHEIGFILGRF